MAMRDRPTLESMLAEAKKRLGSHAATMKALGVSRQRLYSATHGGPPLRIARVLKLGLIANTTPIDALRAGQQHEVAALLEEALTPSDSDITPADRALLRAVARLPADLRSSLLRHIDLLLDALELTSSALDVRTHAAFDETMPGDFSVGDVARERHRHVRDDSPESQGLVLQEAVGQRVSHRVR